jgi:hypothetical protein
MNSLVEQLFACAQPNYAPSGGKTNALISLEHLQRLLG